MAKDINDKNEIHHHDWLVKKIEDRIAKLMTGDIEPSIPIPPKISLEISHIVLPPEKTRKVLEESDIIAILDCSCRKNSSNPCDAPLNVCLIIDSEIAQDAINEREGKKISVSDAMKILEYTTEIGLVHMLLHFRGGAYHAICSCCSCCCHDIVALLKYDRKDLVKKSEYIAKHDTKECLTCKSCIKYCNFKAFETIDDKVSLDEEKCYGCGVCVVHCPSGALRLEKR
ncbi:MAG: 4Fe-4S binding protein [Thermoplasmatales archaeon]|nr:MAG: 4Fe-4S binding protein [Thermoplasmatales archaeon]